VPAIVIGLLGETLAERWRVPAVVTTACGIVPLLPGLTLYRGVLDLTSGRGPEGGIELLLQAGMIAIGLAGGVTLGRIAYRRLRTPVVRAVAPVRARRSPHPEPAPTAEEPLARTGTMPIISTIGVTEPTEDDLAGGAAAAKD
jgi:hypothetical protein